MPSNWDWLFGKGSSGPDQEDTYLPSSPKMKLILQNRKPSDPPQEDPAVRESLNRPNMEPTTYGELAQVMNGDALPKVPRAPQYRQEPFVVGNTRTARMVDDLVKMNPELRGSVRRVMVGPDASASNVLADSKINPLDYGNSSLQGTTSRNRRDVSLNPSLEKDINYDDMLSTLVHEFDHTKGASEDQAYALDSKVPKGLLDKYDKENRQRWTEEYYRNHPERIGTVAKQKDEEYLANQIIAGKVQAPKDFWLNFGRSAK